jgi:hypothetical protein
VKVRIIVSEAIPAVENPTPSYRYTSIKVETKVKSIFWPNPATP